MLGMMGAPVLVEGLQNFTKVEKDTMVTKLSSGNEAADAVFHESGVEIQNQTDVTTARAKIGQNLRLMNQHDFVDRFYFDNNGVFDNEIGSISTIETYAFISYMQLGLSLKVQTCKRQFETETILVSMLEKSRTNGTMDIDRHANNPSGHLLPIHVASGPFVTIVCFSPFVIHTTSPQHQRPYYPPKF
jgi:hypothetical protein